MAAVTCFEVWVETAAVRQTTTLTKQGGYPQGVGTFATDLITRSQYCLYEGGREGGEGGKELGRDR